MYLYVYCKSGNFRKRKSLETVKNCEIERYKYFVHMTFNVRTLTAVMDMTGIQSGVSAELNTAVLGKVDMCVVFANQLCFLIPVASYAILAWQMSSFSSRCMAMMKSPPCFNAGSKAL